MCSSAPKAPKVQQTPAPPPPPEAAPLAPIIDPNQRATMGLAAKRRGLADLRIPLTGPSSVGLNVPQG